MMGQGAMPTHPDSGSGCYAVFAMPWTAVAGPLLLDWHGGGAQPGGGRGSPTQHGQDGWTHRAARRAEQIRLAAEAPIRTARMQSTRQGGKARSRDGR